MPVAQIALQDTEVYAIWMQGCTLPVYAVI